MSVVATGMDGAALSALEPRSFRSVTAAGRKAAEKSAPAFESMADEESVSAFTAPQIEAEPALFEAPAAAQAPAEPAWMFDAPVAEPAPVAAIQPDLIEADFYEAKIEPLAARDSAEVRGEEPLFPDIDHEDRRPQKGGWLSLFGGGRPRYETPPAPSRDSGRDQGREPAKDFARERPAAAPMPQARTVASAQLAEEPKGDEGEDLNIPSFLRRLAN